MTAFLGGIVSVAAFFFVLGVLVLVHEFGHYLAGRLQGFGIDAFSIGFGPKLWEGRGKYNLWQVRWLLFGGFVKFRGEVEMEALQGAPEGQGPGELFFDKPRWRRFIVMVMGVVFNILLAYFLFAGLLMVGLEESLLKDQAPRIGWVAPDSPAAKAGILSGDVLLTLDGRSVANWDRAREEIFSLTQKPYAVQVERGMEKRTFEVEPRTAELLHQPVGDIGVYPALPPIIGGVADPSPALAAGLKPDDRIEALDGASMEYWDQFQHAMLAGGDKPRQFRVLREGRALDITVVPKWDEQAKRFIAGVTPKESAWVRYPFPACLAKAGQITLDQSTLAVRTIKRLVERKIALSSLSGPVSIAYITGKVAQTGFYNILWLMAIISLQLGFFNILPIPGLDGGQILILAAEGLARRDFPAAIKDRILQVGFGLLILLFAVILVMDVAKFF
jgi:regulator of sigma E protease